jgi:hypothetical protein
VDGLDCSVLRLTVTWKPLSEPNANYE